MCSVWCWIIPLFIVVTVTGFDYPKSPPSLAPTVSERACQSIITAHYPPRRTRILDGDIASIGEFPHMVAVGFEYSRRPGVFKFKCGGSLLSPFFVITSGICGQYRKLHAGIARVGSLDISSPSYNTSTDYVIEEAIVHPNFSYATFLHDISLLRLKKSVPVNSLVHAICLYTGKDDPDEAELTIAGWGRSTDVQNTLLMKADTTLLSSSNCSNRLTTDNLITENHICTASRGRGQEACTGDIGGPLQGLTSKTDGHYRLVGIISFGDLNCDRLTVHTRVSRYRYWIEDIVWPV